MTTSDRRSGSQVRPRLAKGDDGSANRYPPRTIVWDEPPAPTVTKVTLLGPAPYGGSYTSTTDDPTVARLIAKGYTVSRTWNVFVGERCVLGHPVWIGSGDPDEGYCDGRCEQYDEAIPEDFEDWYREGSNVEPCDRAMDDRLTDEADGR